MNMSISAFIATCGMACNSRLRTIEGALFSILLPDPDSDNNKALKQMLAV